MRFKKDTSSPNAEGSKGLTNEEQILDQEQDPLQSSGNVEESAVEADIARLSDEIQKLTTERDDLQQQALRTMADFQNYRRRTQNDMAQFRSMANESFVTALLPVLDNFERTVDHIEAGATLETMLEGVRAVEKQLRSTLESQNLKRIEALGQPFDPNLHEAIGVVEAEGMEPNTVVDEVEPGYKLGDKVIRPARVRVSGS